MFTRLQVDEVPIFVCICAGINYSSVERERIMLES